MYCNRLIPPENIELRKATNPLKSSKTPGVGGEGGGRGEGVRRRVLKRRVASLALTPLEEGWCWELCSLSPPIHRIPEVFRQDYRGSTGQCGGIFFRFLLETFIAAEPCLLDSGFWLK